MMKHINHDDCTQTGIGERQDLPIEHDIYVSTAQNFGGDQARDVVREKPSTRPQFQREMGCRGNAARNHLIPLFVDLSEKGLLSYDLAAKFRGLRIIDIQIFGKWMS